MIISFDLAYVNMVPPAVVLGDPDATETLCSDLETHFSAPPRDGDLVAVARPARDGGWALLHSPTDSARQIGATLVQAVVAVMHT
jgi:hypothetical protein